MVTKRLVLHFPHRLVDRPIVYKLIKDYDLVMNILKASITPNEEGFMVIELQGEKDKFAEGIKYLEESGVVIDPIGRDVKRNDERCTSCGACVTICPTDALTYEPVTRQVVFNDEKCIACEICVKTCPLGAMEVHF
ncbi:MAG: NIL domain-containing protein [Actinomycetota bacterium]